MPSQTRRHTRNVRNQAAHLFAKANRLARKVEARINPDRCISPMALDAAIWRGDHGQWCKMVLIAAHLINNKAEEAWMSTLECPHHSPTAPARHRAERRRLLQDGDLETCSYTDTTHGFLNSSACV